MRAKTSSSPSNVRNEGMHAQSAEEVLTRTETRSEDVERRFEKVERDFDEDVRIMKDETAKLEGLLKKLVKT